MVCCNEALGGHIPVTSRQHGYLQGCVTTRCFPVTGCSPGCEGSTDVVPAPWTAKRNTTLFTQVETLADSVTSVNQAAGINTRLYRISPLLRSLATPISVHAWIETKCVHCVHATQHFKILSTILLSCYRREFESAAILQS